MTTPIRPFGPGGPGSIALEGAGAPEAASEVGPGEAPSASVEVGASTRVGSGEAPSVEGTTESVLARLAAGELTREQAVDSLVAQALEAHGAHLGAAQRSELAAVLRASLLDDPALGQLLG